MKAYKCDICGRLFESTPRPGIVMSVLGRDDAGNTQEFQLEFCDSCCGEVMQALQEVGQRHLPHESQAEVMADGGEGNAEENA